MKKTPSYSPNEPKVSHWMCDLTWIHLFVFFIYAYLPFIAARMDISTVRFADKAVGSSHATETPGLPTSHLARGRKRKNALANSSVHECLDGVHAQSFLRGLPNIMAQVCFIWSMHYLLGKWEFMAINLPTKFCRWWRRQLHVPNWNGRSYSYQ